MRLTGQEAIKYAIEHGLNLNSDDDLLGLSVAEAKRLDPETVWVDTYDPLDAASRETHNPA